MRRRPSDLALNMTSKLAEAATSLQGREQIYQGCAEAMKIFEVQVLVIANTRFRVNGDEATGTGVVLFTGVPDARKPGEQVVSGGHYDWRFRRTPDG